MDAQIKKPINLACDDWSLSTLTEPMLKGGWLDAAQLVTREQRSVKLLPTSSQTRSTKSITPRLQSMQIFDAYISSLVMR